MVLDWLQKKVLLLVFEAEMSRFDRQCNCQQNAADMEAEVPGPAGMMEEKTGEDDERFKGI